MLFYLAIYFYKRTVSLSVYDYRRRKAAYTRGGSAAASKPSLPQYSALKALTFHVLCACMQGTPQSDVPVAHYIPVTCNISGKPYASRFTHCMCVCMYICMFVCTYACTYTSVCVCMYVRIYVCMYVCAYMSVCVYMYVC